MRANKLLQKIVKMSCGFIHEKRLNALVDVVDALIVGGKLTMTELGNSLSDINKVCEKHAVKRVSNLLSNAHLLKESSIIQKNMALHVLQSFTKVRLIVDWTHTNTKNYYILRATLVMNRSNVAIYQEVHHASKQNSPKVYPFFLDNLKQCMPKHINEVTVITDAGFYVTWFRMVEARGWQFVGRVRGHCQIKLEGNDKWEYALGYAGKSDPCGKYLGEGLLTKTNKHKVDMYTCKHSLKHLNKKSQRSLTSLRRGIKSHIRSSEEGWFLVTNLEKLSKKDKQAVIGHYKDRMKIEASNRLTKSTKYGFGLSDSMTKKPNRLKILLLIEQIASLVTWLIGANQEKNGSISLYSNGSWKNRHRRLSLVNLGVRVYKKGRLNIPISSILKMLGFFAAQEAAML